MSDEIRGYCWYCSHPLTAADFGRETNCYGCSKATRVCRNCRHFAPGRPNDCVEPMAEPILEKERPNFCEHFEPTDKPIDTGVISASEDLMRAAENLFK